MCKGDAMIQKIKSWFFSPYSLILALVILLDQLTKIWAQSNAVNITVIPEFFYLVYARNTGAAWSIFEGELFLLASISFVVGVGLLIYFLYQFKNLNTFNKLAITLFLAGTWGNFIDRAFYQIGVIDFLSFHFGTYIFPTFNIADSALTISVIMLIVYALFEEKLKKKI
jgi:signal peptidase II